MLIQNKGSQNPSDLASNAKRAVTTGFIGALSKFEEGFGYLWGKGKEELSENEKKFLTLWLKVRNDVLDCGNRECRRIEQEFDKYIIKYNGYQYRFKVRSGNGNV